MSTPSQKLLSQVIIKISQTINNLQLNRTEKEVLSQIQYLDNKNGCHATNQYLSDKLGICVRQIQRIILKLKKLELIVYELFNNCGRVMRTVKDKIGDKIPNVTPPAKKSSSIYKQNKYFNKAQSAKDYKDKIHDLNMFQREDESDTDFDTRCEDRNQIGGVKIIKTYHNSNPTIRGTSGQDVKSILLDYTNKFKIKSQSLTQLIRV